MTDKTKIILRWIFFVPLSILISETVNYLFNMMGDGTLGVFFPQLGHTVSGIVTYASSGAVLIYTAYLIIPTHKKIALKVYTIFWSALTLCWTIFFYYLAEKGVAGSFWYPLLLNLSFFIGMWLSYLRFIWENLSETS
jgi:hypothetical protein